MTPILSSIFLVIYTSVSVPHDVVPARQYIPMPSMEVCVEQAPAIIAHIQAPRTLTQTIDTGRMTQAIGAPAPSRHLQERTTTLEGLRVEGSDCLDLDTYLVATPAG